MARLPSATLLAVCACLLICLSSRAFAQTTITHGFETTITSTAASHTATTTLNHDFHTSSKSTKAKATTTLNHDFHTSSKSAAATSIIIAGEDAAEKKEDAAACQADPKPELRTEAPYCEIQGNADFYGLGVRLGIYFTWLTSWVANNFLPEEMAGAFDTNSIFLFALELTVIYYTALYKINAIDALVLIQLAFGFVFSVMSLWGYRTMYYRKEGLTGKKYFGGWGTHFRLLLMMGISVYALWFWTEGLHDGLPSCAKDIRKACGGPNASGLWTFLFIKVDLYGPIRWMYLAAAIACCLYYGIMCLAAIAAAIDRVINALRNRKNEWELQEVDVMADGLNRKELTTVAVALSAFNLIWMLFAAMSVEFTLNWNNVTGVLFQHGVDIGAGQLLPMFIGLFSFMRVVYLCFLEYFWDDHDNEEAAAAEGDDQKGVRGLGMTGMTPEGLPMPRRKKQTRDTVTSQIKSAKQRRQKNAVHRVVTAWLPWLSTFEWWRGDSHSFALVSDTPYTPSSPELQMRRLSGRPLDKRDDVRVSEEDTEYRGHTP